MKLFKSLLIAPATLGLLAPMSATASEVTVSDFTPEEQLAITNSRVDGLEARVNNIEAGSFSETTTASFGANFYMGAVDDDDAGDDRDDNVTTGYDFSIGLETSFTGEDLLTVNIEAGDSDQAGIGEFAGDSTTNEALTVDEINYQFPLGGFTVMVGDNTDASTLFTTACVYGTPSDTLDACGNVNAAVDNGGVMAGASYDFGNGLTAAVGWAGDENDVMNEEGTDAYGVNVAYTTDTFGVSATFGATEDGSAAPIDNQNTDTFVALNAYYDPEAGGLPSLSVGYEIGEDASVVGDNDGLSNFFVGLGWDEVGPGSLGIAMGTRVNTVEDTDEQYMYEVYYSYDINDGMTITPLFFIQEQSAANTDDTTGVMVKTSFSF